MEPIEIYTDFLDTYYVPGEVLFGLGGYDYIQEQLKWYYYISRDDFEKIVYEYIKNYNREFHMLKKPMSELDVNMIYPSCRAYYDDVDTASSKIRDYHKIKGQNADKLKADARYIRFLVESYNNDIVYCHVHDAKVRNRG